MKKNTIKSLCGAAVLLACASSANAITSDSIRVSFDNGATWDTVADNQVGRDSNPAANIIVASFNNLALTISVGGTGTGIGVGSPVLDISIGGLISSGLSAIVEFSANGFTPPSTGSYTTTQQVGGSGYTVTETTRIGTGANGNTLFAAGGLLPTIGPLSAPQVLHSTSSGSAPVGTSNPYSITISDVITGTPDGSGILSIDSNVKVPDGGDTMMLLGSALSVLGGMSIFRKKAIAA